MRRWFFAALLPLTLACSSKVDGGGDDCGECGCDPEGEIDGCSTSSTGGQGSVGSGGAGSGASSTGGASTGGASAGGAGGTVAANGIAMLESELPDPPDPSSGVSTSSSGGGGPDPNTLRISFSDLLQACNDWYANLPCGGHWEIQVSLPPEAQHAGVVSLATPGVYVSFSETGTEAGPECSFGGGGWGSDGEITVVSIDDRHVTIDFGDMQPVGPASGPLTAIRCF